MFGAVHENQLQQANIQKPYEVTALPGQVEKSITVYKVKREIVLRNGNKRPVYEKTVEKELVPAGYMVTFPNGSALRIDSEDELKRLGLHMVPGLVNMETGDVVLPNQEAVQKQINLMTLLPTSYVPAMNVETGKKKGEQNDKS